MKFLGEALKVNTVNIMQKLASVHSSKSMSFADAHHVKSSQLSNGQPCDKIPWRSLDDQSSEKNMIHPDDLTNDFDPNRHSPRWRSLEIKS